MEDITLHTDPRGIWLLIAILLIVCVGLGYIFYRGSSTEPIITDEPSTLDKTTKNKDY